MFKDNAAVWVLEYIFGAILVVAPLTSLRIWRLVRLDAHIWAVQLFVVCLGVTLISCASSMRQRMLLARRIDRLAQQMADSPTPSQQSATTESQGKSTSQ